MSFNSSCFFETVESRQMLNADVGDVRADTTETQIALLVPAVQAAREAASTTDGSRTSSSDLAFWGDLAFDSTYEPDSTSSSKDSKSGGQIELESFSF